MAGGNESRYCDLGERAEGETRERRPIPVSNQYMFGRVMCDESICRDFLGLVLDIEVTSIDYVNAKQVLEPTLTRRGAELDLFVRAREGVFDIEMECQRRGSLGRRFRFYQGAMDARELRKGADFDELPASAIVFVCEFDPFGLGVPVYRVEPSCEGISSADLGFDQIWIALNCPAWGLLPDGALRNLLVYLAEGRVEPDDPLVRRIDDAVAEANDDEGWVESVYAVSRVFEDQAREARIQARAARREGEQEGLRRGIEQGQERLSALVAALLKDGRADDAAAVADPARRAELFEEYGL